jgi:hypothetical protein
MLIAIVSFFFKKRKEQKRYVSALYEIRTMFYEQRNLAAFFLKNVRNISPMSHNLYNSDQKLLIVIRKK